jgi:alginate O-acetyltransferase complex protein AlgI
MLFNSHGFLFVFLPVVLAAFFLTRGVVRKLTVLAASLVFYGFSGLTHLGLLVFVTVAGYLGMRIVAHDRNPWHLAGIAVVVLLPLMFTKYFDWLAGYFVSGSEGQPFRLFGQFILPAGISFFTFQILSAIADDFRGQVKRVPRFLDFAIYVSFFPQLVAGPIVRFEYIRQRIEHLEVFRFSRSRLELGLAFVIVGLAFKVLLADVIGAEIDRVFRARDFTVLTGGGFVLGYSMQIYFDFYGYSLVAIGLGRILGIKLPRNFLRPYSAPDPREFWRRWHVTLSSWLRDYVYIPLGGRERYARNLLVTFVICGVWHGAGFNFVLWGVYHWFLIVAWKAIRGPWERLPGFLRVLGTFLAVSIGWLPFYFNAWPADFAAGFLVGAGMEDLTRNLGFLAIVVTALAVCFGLNAEGMVVRLQRRGKWRVASTLFYAVLGLLVILGLGESKDFIYFRF